MKGSGRDLAEVGAIIDQKLPATDEFALEGRLTGATEALTLMNAQGIARRGRARRGSVSLTLKGEIKNLLDLGGLLREQRLSEEVRSHLDIAVDVKSKGNSMHDLMAGLNGSMGAVMGQG